MHRKLAGGGVRGEDGGGGEGGGVLWELPGSERRMGPSRDPRRYMLRGRSLATGPF